MAIIQCDHHSVDQAGHVAVTAAAHCDLAAASTILSDENKRPLPSGKLRKRAGMLIRHHTSGCRTKRRIT